MATQVAFPGTVSTETGPSGDNDWTDAANISANDGSEAQITAPTYDSGDHSFRLRASNFGFTIPAGATIDGITVEIEQRRFAGAARDQEVRLFDETGTLVGDDKATATAWPGTATIATYGGAADDWLPAGSWTPAQVNDPDFGVAHIVAATAANTDIGVDFVRITIHYTPAPETIDAQPGSFTLTGADATLQRGFSLDAQPGSFALTGTDATPQHGYVLVAHPPLPTPTVIDTFTGTDGEDLVVYSTEWTEMDNPGVHHLLIQTNQLKGVLGAFDDPDDAAYWNVATFNADCAVRAIVDASLDGGGAWLVARITNPGASWSGYEAGFLSIGPAKRSHAIFYRVDAGVKTKLAEIFLGFEQFPPGTEMHFVLVGSSLMLFKNGVLVASVVDTTYTTGGYVGVDLSRPGAAAAFTLFDNFGADNITFFNITGVNAGLLADRMIDAQPGVFTLTGFAATLAKGFAINAQPGSFSETGVDANLLADRALDAQPGSITLTGFNATLAVGKVFNAEPGTFVLTGMLAELVKGYVLDAQPGSFVLTGNAAALIADRVLSADPGAIILTGVDAALIAERLIVADPGVYVVTGFDAALISSGEAQGFELNAEPGVFIVTGVDAGLLVDRVLNAEPGSFTVTGVDASLIAERLLNAEPGAFVLTGFNAWAGLNVEQFPEGGGEDFISIVNE